MGPLSPLPITLPRRGSRALLSSLHNQLRLAILDGRLKPGIRLPSTRALAASLVCPEIRRSRRTTYS